MYEDKDKRGLLSPAMRRTIWAAAAAKRFLLIDGHKNSVTFLAPSLSAPQ